MTKQVIDINSDNWNLTKFRGHLQFDLPTGEKWERKAYTRFRNFLLDNGYTMAQFSVYIRTYAGKEAVEAFAKKLEARVPEAGAVNMLTITDKQYENTISFRGKMKKNNQNPDQYVLF